MDISGPYEETSRGNQYILSFVDWLTGQKLMPIPDKKVQKVEKKKTKVEQTEPVTFQGR